MFEKCWIIILFSVLYIRGVSVLYLQNGGVIVSRNKNNSEIEEEKSKIEEMIKKIDRVDILKYIRIIVSDIIEDENL